MADVAKLLPDIEATGTQLAFVHVGTEPQAQTFFQAYGVEQIPRFSSPDGALYRSFQLKRAKLKFFLNGDMWKRGMESFRKGHIQKKTIGDPWRMPGLFLIQQGKILRSYRHVHMGNRPDYLEFLQGNQESAAMASKEECAEGACSWPVS